MQHKRQLVHAAMVVDGAGRRFRPGAVLLEGMRIIAAGTPAHIGRCDDVSIRNSDQFVLMPALVNAHAHLDLTHVGPVSRSGSFAQWIATIRSARATDDEAIAASVRRGAELSLAGGVAIVGDIAGMSSAAAVEAMRGSPLRGVSYFEVFGIGARQQRGIELMRSAVATIAHDADGVQLGVSPHAPYSCGLDVYRAAAATGLPVATHLAETLEELQFVESAGGPMRDLLVEFGVWDDSIAGCGVHPVQLLVEVLRETPVAAAHVNYVDDALIELLATTQVSVVYCPRASSYFGHPWKGISHHRYCEMLDAGINVALGTDSIVCLDTAEQISTLDEMRLLYQRDGADPELLVRMATVNGARALRMDESLVTFREGDVAGVIAVEIDPDSDVDPLVQVMRGHVAPVWVSG